MITPNPSLQVFQNKLNLPKKELLLEIELNGKMKFEHLMNTIYNQWGYVIECYQPMWNM
jgi:hypothetical protein